MPCRRLPIRPSRMLVAIAAGVLGGLTVPATGLASGPGCAVAADQPAVSSSAPPLRFGIYPGGPVGTVNPVAPPRPEDPVKRLAALRTLAGGKPFVVRLYSAWTGDAAADDPAGWLDAEISGYTEAGLQVELAVRYKPAGPDAGGAPAAFADHVRGIVRRYGADPRFVSLQVTNEANVPGAPNASDGAFAGAAQAVVDGVVAAKQQVRRDGRGHLRVGFSWAYDERPAAAGEFWATLGRLGGRTFAESVDWVGLDTYPGTWVPQIPASSLLPELAGSTVQESVRTLRDCLMPKAGLGRATDVHIAENGFPTGAGRSDALQSQVLESMVRGVDAIRGAYGITDYRWFDLRDSSSADPSLESQYGITRDDYAPKPAFETYRRLIARNGGERQAAKAAECRRSPVRVAVPRGSGRDASSVVVRVGDKVVKRLPRSKTRRSVRVSLRPGRAAVRVEVTRRVDGRSQTDVRRSSYRIC